MKIKLSILLALISVMLMGQNTLQINGLNEAELVYRTVPDSLKTYFSNRFGFNLGYGDFRFGMSFNARLPEYSNQASELLDELDPNRLSVAWEELYAEYSHEAFSIHVGSTEESFGRGITFRSYEDLEFDEDHRINSFLLKYDDTLQFKTFYGAIASQNYSTQYDLAYGADLQYPVGQGLRLGASALGYRNIGAASHYSFRDVFSGRMMLSKGNFDVFSEYALSKKYHLPGASAQDGSAIFADANYMIGNLILGGAYKRYEDISYRLQDLPLANYHLETISDALASGIDEEGWQARAAYALSSNIYLSADYAEAWDSSKDKRMNDLYLEAEIRYDSKQYLVSWSHIEKIDDATRHWQKEYYPTIDAQVVLAGQLVSLTGEFKRVEKQDRQIESNHYEPMLQASFTIDKLSLSLGVSSWWEDFSTLVESRYRPNIEIKYPLFSHTDLTLFGGKEAGGKVCRNGICRYVAPFEGLRAELSTRF